MAIFIQKKFVEVLGHYNFNCRPNYDRNFSGVIARSRGHSDRNAQYHHEPVANFIDFSMLIICWASSTVSKENPYLRGQYAARVRINGWPPYAQTVNHFLKVQNCH
jgi:hypothetical protein